MLKNTLTLFGIFFSMVCFGQTDQLVVAKYIHLPADSLQSKQLIASLNGFLNQTAKPNNENVFVLKDDLPETSALLDEIKGMENGSGPDKKNEYKCYLTNVMLLDSNNYIVQFSYMGINESTAVLRASFKVIAKKSNSQYYFCSPLKRNTISWQVKNVGNAAFYYNAPVDLTRANGYVKKAREFDKKLHAKDYPMHIYFFNNLNNLLELLGVEYKSDYNGIGYDNSYSFENNISSYFVGAGTADPAFLDIHDLWHERLHRVIPVATINRPVDEGCAYLYGGSWGTSWPEIFKQFKAYMGTNKDWLATYNESKKFSVNRQYPLYTSYVINALIVQQIEKEKGFGAVIELLSCGKKEKDNENYFKAIDKITGISKTNFNQYIQKLVDNEAVK